MFLELSSATSVHMVLLYFRNDGFIYVRTNGQYKTVNCFIRTVQQTNSYELWTVLNLLETSGASIIVLSYWRRQNHRKSIHGYATESGLALLIEIY